jgi:asparagine synthase (glutamine-hydrolysing)
MLRASRGEFAETGLASGVTVCDPTADLRLVRFCLALPDAQFAGPRGEGRWLVRRLMMDALPPEVLWSRRRGRQASDLALRYTATAGEVEAALAICESSSCAAEIVDLRYLRETWRAIRGRADAASQQRAVAILSRGLMAGLFLADVAPHPPQLLPREESVAQ